MENASKALIIAGAILLSIAIIGIGMTVFNNVSPLISNTGMDEQEVATFNQKFTPYGGTQRGNKVRALIEVVNANNRSNVDDISKCIAMVGAGNATAVGTDGAETYDGDGILSGRNYSVTFGYDDTGVGIITTITIETP